MTGTFDPNTSWRFHVFLLALAFGLFYAVGLPFGLLGLPLIGWVVARWVVLMPGWIWRRTKEQIYKDWQGRHFIFGGEQIRIHWDEKSIWIVADDVFRTMSREPDAIERKKIAARLGNANFFEHPELEGECFSEEGLARYLAGLREEETRKFRRWLEREILPNIRKLREMNADTYRQYALKEPKAPQ